MEPNDIEEHDSSKVNYTIAAEIRDIGLSLIHNRSKSVQVQDRRFRAHFAVSWVQGAVLWADVQPEVVHFYAKRKPKIIHLFFALLFLKTYQTEMQRAAFFSCDEKTMRLWTWRYVEAIGLLEGQKVRKCCLTSYLFYIQLTFFYLFF